MLHRTVIAALCGLLLFSSCQSRVDSGQLAVIDEGLARADHFIQTENKALYHQIDMKRYDPRMRLLVDAWLPVIARIWSLDSMVDRIGVDNQSQAAQKLIEYRRNLVESLDAALPDVSDYIRSDIGQVKLRLAAHSDSGVLATSFSLSPEVLSKLKIDFRLTENQILSYCNKMSTAIIEPFERFEVLAGLENGHLRPGEAVEIFAGIGAFSLKADPTVKINGQVIKASRETGIALDTLTADSRPGKYKIPIEITFTRPDGSRQTIKKNLSYTVGER